MKILVAGSTGQVARALARRGAEAGQTVVLLGRDAWSITDHTSVSAVLEAEAPDLVVNAAAYTAVDAAEDDLAGAYELNAAAPAVLARACAAAAVPFVHFSTDYVFSGDKGAPYVETDPTAPLGVYGRSKLAGEDEVRAAGGRNLILRTAWVYDGEGRNFLRTMLRLSKDRQEIGVVDDQRGAPTFADDIADVTLALGFRFRDGASLPPTLHLTNAGEATWWTFACAIMEEAQARGFPNARIKPITTAEYPTKARRPADSRLSGEALAASLGREMPHWRAALTACFDRVGSRIAAF